jgi:hypothetical protein
MRQPSVTTVERAIVVAQDRFYDALYDLDHAKGTAAKRAAKAERDAAEAALVHARAELIAAKLRQQNAPPNSIRAASGGRTSPR